jgi:endonuclease/exonuclease/phosphatase family metal-dependent hydrolase
VLAQTTTQEPITILTYNIRHGVGMDYAMNLERQAAIIKACEADVVG